MKTPKNKSQKILELLEEPQREKSRAFRKTFEKEVEIRRAKVQDLLDQLRDSRTQ